MPRTDGRRDIGRRGRRSLRLLRLIVGAGLMMFCLPGGAVLLLARYSSSAGRWPTLLTSVLPWAVPLLALSLVGAALLWSASRPVAVVGLVLSVAGLGQLAFWMAPDYLGSHAHGRPDLTVMELNTNFGQADPRRTVELARHWNADVVVLSEITPAALAGLDAVGLSRALPHEAGLPNPSRYGVMIFSRYAMTTIARLPVSRGGWEIRVDAPRPFTLIAGHTGQPLVGIAQWQRDFATMHAAVAHAAGPRLVVGDFNATLQTRPMRDLLAVGLRDAAEQANSGWQPTWPGSVGAPVLRTVGLMAIDHVLLDDSFEAIRTSTADVPASDHRALVAEIALEPAR